MPKKDPYLEFKMKQLRKKHRRIPKWFTKKVDDQLKYIFYHEKHGRFPTAEERILIKLQPYTVPYRINRIADATNIDYKNISRNIKSLERKKLVEIKDNYNLEKQKSGRYKTYHYKEIYATQEGKRFIRKRLGYKGY